MTIRIGAGPIGWFEDDFSAFRNDIAREAHLTAIGRAGFNGICLNPGSPREVACVHASLARHGLDFIAPTHRVSLVKQSAAQVFQTLQPHLRGARALGAGEVGVSEAASGPFTEAGWQRFADRLTELAQSFGDLGLRLVYRPRIGGPIADAAAVDRLMAMTPASVGLMLEASVLGAETTAVAGRHGARIAMVAPEMATDAVMDALPQFQGWTVLDEHAGHAPERVRHMHEIADEAVAA